MLNKMVIITEIYHHVVITDMVIKRLTGLSGDF